MLLRGEDTNMRALSLELRYLIYVAILMAVIWVPYILAHIAQVGPNQAFSYPDPVEMPPWAVLLKRAHYNLVENVPLFAIAVLAGEARNVHTATTAACAAIFFWARLAHPIATVAKIWGTRTAAFAIGWAAVVVYLFVMLTA
jgi:uncharacterized membrane protein YecN with MAPEG domain